METLVTLFYDIPNWLLFVIMCAAGILFTVGGIHIVKLILPIELRLRDNVAIGYISANTSVLFSVLAGFVVMYMLTNYNRALEVVRIEVNKSAAIYNNAKRLDDYVARGAQLDIKEYLEIIINDEWPAMQRGEKIISPALVKKGNFNLYGEESLNKLRSKLNKYRPKDFNRSLALVDIYQNLEDLYDARDERLSLNESALDSYMWFALLVGAALTMIANFVYGIEHYHLHQSLAPFVSILVVIILFMIVSIDQPFRGIFSIKPKEYQEVLVFINNEISCGL